MLCREEERDPRRCLNEGKAVTSCATDVLKKMKKHCLEDFNAYMYCLERSSGSLEFHPYVTLYLTILILFQILCINYNSISWHKMNVT